MKCPMPKKVALVRYALLIVLVATATLICCPIAWILICPLFFPGQSACFCCPSPCTHCEVTPNRGWQVDFDNFANTTACTLPVTDCRDVFNRTWIYDLFNFPGSPFTCLPSPFPSPPFAAGLPYTCYWAPSASREFCVGPTPTATDCFHIVPNATGVGTPVGMIVQITDGLPFASFSVWQFGTVDLGMGVSPVKCVDIIGLTLPVLAAGSFCAPAGSSPTCVVTRLLL